jgi:uncharacterized damage-inducible protein DinB
MSPSVTTPVQGRVMSIRAFYDRWPQYNRRLTEIVAGLSDEQLSLRPGPERWPIWATAGHTAAVRVYWLCHVLGESGASTTPWGDPAAEGWEDDLAHPRTAGELSEAFDATFAIVARCLDRWIPEMLADEFERTVAGQRQTHSRSSVLQRLLTHDAYHIGEISQTLAIHGLEAADIWRSD